PSSVRVLDLGCAGGRNAAYLAAEGFQVLATDFSEAMVKRTRERLTEYLGSEGAAQCCWQAPMWDLETVESGSVDLIIGLGIYHNAGSKNEWDKTLTESARVLTPGGKVLMASFSPRMQLGEKALKPYGDDPHVYEGFDSGLSTLMSPADLDAAVSAVGWAPFVPTELVEREVEGGRRSTVNALYIQR
ncbi:MAG: class I SAM-dependent methyltransferase, partial [Candidatus Eisenbacteria bacterium]|nr:class I SAM-dependent methyltransferase [Candidatus Eisenbacteria bacterium]